MSMINRRHDKQVKKSMRPRGRWARHYHTEFSNTAPKFQSTRPHHSTFTMHDSLSTASYELCYSFSTPIMCPMRKFFFAFIPYYSFPTLSRQDRNQKSYFYSAGFCIYQTPLRLFRRRRRRSHFRHGSKVLFH